MIYAFPMFESFRWFVIERYRIYERRAAGKPAPWTKNEILATYKFCNVYRECDRVTKWIADHWRGPYASYEHLWFAMVVARLINRPATLEEFALPGRWNKKHFLSVMQTRRMIGERAFGSAYIVSTAGRSMDKAEYLAKYVLDPMWERRKMLKPREGQTLASYHEQLMRENGMGSFMAAQIVADLKYVQPLLSASDWWTFASSGPGSRRGMWYVMGEDPKKNNWREHEWRNALHELQVLMTPVLRAAHMPRMHAQDLQNCLCEYHKFRRTELGTGRPKQRFVPFEET